MITNTESPPAADAEIGPGMSPASGGLVPCESSRPDELPGLACSPAASPAATCRSRLPFMYAPRDAVELRARLDALEAKLVEGAAAFARFRARYLAPLGV